MSFGLRRSAKRPVLDCGEGLTRPEFKAQCTPRIQVERFLRDGVMYQTPVKPMFGDFSNISSYQECLQRVIDIDAHFASLPSSVRSKFSNNPSELFSFLSDVKNRDEAIALGLIAKPSPTFEQNLDSKLDKVLERISPPEAGKT